MGKVRMVKLILLIYFILPSLSKISSHVFERLKRCVLWPVRTEKGGTVWDICWPSWFIALGLFLRGRLGLVLGTWAGEAPGL